MTASVACGDRRALGFAYHSLKWLVLVTFKGVITSGSLACRRLKEAVLAMAASLCCTCCQAHAQAHAHAHARTGGGESETAAPARSGAPVHVPPEREEARAPPEPDDNLPDELRHAFPAPGLRPRLSVLLRASRSAPGLQQLGRSPSISQQLYATISSIPQHLDELGTSLDQALDDHILHAEREKERLRMTLSASSLSREENARQTSPVRGHELL